MNDNSYRSLNMLIENDTKVRQDALRVLLKICDNIIKYPNVAKYRRIQVANATICDKLLPVYGGIECLFELGFVEDGEYFLLPSNAPLSRVENIEKLLRKLWDQQTISTSASTSIQSTSTKKMVQSPLDFCQTITKSFQSVLIYEDKNLQKITKRLIPIIKLQLAAINNLRAIQKKIKHEGCNGNDEWSVEDLLLAELLYWFKNEFFTWVDSPTCSSCNNQCSFNRTEYAENPKISRIEIHKCEICGNEERFVRYTDPEILLSTRKGRCGEWANVFTLICRTLGYDARIVYDKTDHVWTEVWSITSKRWIHLDPCENAMDRPLLYEKGWKKQLSYIIAYSKDEIQDVTWRYTRDQAAVMKRRNLCSESTLSELIERLNTERQNSIGYSNNRKQYVMKRRLMELVEFLQAPPGFKKSSDNDDKNEYGGRISGNATWRLARGELSHIPHIWIIPHNVCRFHLRYFIVKDLYDVHDENDKVLETKKFWKDGVETCDGDIFRNVENDWKMVYLARSPDNPSGKITWSFHVNDDSMNIDSFQLQTSSTTFNGASVEWSVTGVNRDNSSTVLEIPDCKLFKTKELGNARKIIVTAKLSGGNGDISWQHAQLFRQSINATEECSLSIILSLNKSTV